jgi:CBS domain-containing protein
MHTGSAMTRDIITAPLSLTLRAAWAIMESRRIRHLPVVQGSRLVGILSDRDILSRATLDPAEGFIVPDGVVVGAAMTLAPITCSMATTISWVAETMVQGKIDAIPVVEADDVLVGLVTSTDLLALLIDHDEAKLLPFDFRLVDADAPSEAA